MLEVALRINCVEEVGCKKRQVSFEQGLFATANLHVA